MSSLCVCARTPDAPLGGVPGRAATDGHKHTHDFVFRLKAIGPGPPTQTRVKHLLKALARRYGLRVSWPEPCACRSAERDENTERLDFSPTEAGRMAELLAPYERKAAKERQRKHGNTAPGRSNTSADSAGVNSETRDILAEAVGMSHDTLRKVQLVRHAASSDPDNFGDLPGEYANATQFAGGT